jgi:hypothetical protein
MDSIIQILQNRKIHSNALYNRLITLLKRRLSLRDYNLHLERMKYLGLILKEDTGGRGIKVFFSLTEKGRRSKELKINFIVPKG